MDDILWFVEPRSLLLLLLFFGGLLCFGSNYCIVAVVLSFLVSWRPSILFLWFANHFSFNLFASLSSSLQFFYCFPFSGLLLYGRLCLACFFFCCVVLLLLWFHNWVSGSSSIVAVGLSLFFVLSMLGFWLCSLVDLGVHAIDSICRISFLDGCLLGCVHCGSSLGNVWKRKIRGPLFPDVRILVRNQVPIFQFLGRNRAPLFLDLVLKPCFHLKPQWSRWFHRIFALQFCLFFRL